MEIPDPVMESILETQQDLSKAIQLMNQTMMIQLRLLESLLPKPFSYDPENMLTEYDPPVGDFEDVELFEPIDIDEDINEALDELSE